MAKRWLSISAGVVAVAVIGLGIGGYMWAMQPAVSKPANQTPEVQGASTTVAPNVTLTSGHFVTKVSSTFVMRNHNSSSVTGILDQILMVSPADSGGDQLAVTVGVLPAEGVNGISGVQVRKHNPGVYTVTEQADAPSGSLAFVSGVNGYERAVFVPHSGEYAAIVLSGNPSRQDELDEEMNVVLANWQWR